MIALTGKVLRILPVKVVNRGNATKRVVDHIIADEFDYTRVSLWDARRVTRAARAYPLIMGVHVVPNRSVLTRNRKKRVREK